MTLRQEVEVHEIHAESDYDEDDEGPVAGADGSLSNLLRSRNRKEPFENLPRPSSHRSVPQHDPHADDYDEDDDGPETGFFVGLHEPFENLPRLHPSVLQTPSNENY